MANIFTNLLDKIRNLFSGKVDETNVGNDQLNNSSPSTTGTNEHLSTIIPNPVYSQESSTPTTNIKDNQPINFSTSTTRTIQPVETNIPGNLSNDPSDPLDLTTSRVTAPKDVILKFNTKGTEHQTEELYIAQLSDIKPTNITTIEDPTQSKPLTKTTGSSNTNDLINTTAPIGEANNHNLSMTFNSPAITVSINNDSTANTAITPIVGVTHNDTLVTSNSSPINPVVHDSAVNTTETSTTEPYPNKSELANISTKIESTAIMPPISTDYVNIKKSQSSIAGTTNTSNLLSHKRIQDVIKTLQQKFGLSSHSAKVVQENDPTQTTPSY
jgi:hypothetical protein